MMCNAANVQRDSHKCRNTPILARMPCFSLRHRNFAITSAQNMADRMPLTVAALNASLLAGRAPKLSRVPR